MRWVDVKKARELRRNDSWSDVLLDAQFVLLILFLSVLLMMVAAIRLTVSFTMKLVGHVEYTITAIARAQPRTRTLLLKLAKLLTKS